MRALILVPTLLLATPAQAHIVASRLGDFYAGAAHPLAGLEDVILWLSLGVLAGLQPPGRARWLIPLFPLGLLAGLGLGRWAGVSGGAALDAGMMVALGGLTAAGVRLPASVLCAVGVAVALVRGAANASGIGPDTSLALFAGGFAAAGYVVFTLGAAAAAAFSRAGWRNITLRAAGSWVAAVGVMAGGFALRGG